MQQGQHLEHKVTRHSFRTSSVPSNPLISEQQALLVLVKQMLHHSKITFVFKASQRGYEEIQGFEIRIGIKPHTLFITLVKYSFQ
jgi:hypothetical protein